MARQPRRPIRDRPRVLLFLAIPAHLPRPGGVPLTADLRRAPEILRAVGLNANG